MITKIKVNSNSGASSWDYADDDTSLHECMNWCATGVAADKADGKLTNQNCDKGDETPYLDHNFKPWSGS